VAQAGEPVPTQTKASGCRLLTGSAEVGKFPGGAHPGNVAGEKK